MAAHEHTHNHTHEEKHHFFSNHSHDTADSIDNALEGSNEGIRAVKISLLILGVAAILQLAVALLSGSIALFADTIHNFADASTSIVLWLAFSLGRKAANKRYTYGFGRAEDIAGIFIILMIAGSSIFAFWEAFQRLIHPHLITNLGIIAIASIIGFLANEAVARYRIKTGKKIGSAALVADGYHARTDGFTSLAVLVGVLGVKLGFAQADSLIGIGITIAIAFVLKDATIQVWHRLMDAVNPDLIEEAQHTVSHVKDVQDITSLKMRWVGHSLFIEANIVVDCDLPLEKAHDIGEEARHALFHQIPKLANATIHIEPCEHNGKKAHEKCEHHDKKAPHLN